MFDLKTDYVRDLAVVFLGVDFKQLWYEKGCDYAYPQITQNYLQELDPGKGIHCLSADFCLSCLDDLPIESTQELIDKIDKNIASKVGVFASNKINMLEIYKTNYIEAYAIIEYLCSSEQNIASFYYFWYKEEIDSIRKKYDILSSSRWYKLAESDRLLNRFLKKLSKEKNEPTH